MTSLPDRKVPELNPVLFSQLMTTFDGATWVMAFRKSLKFLFPIGSPLNKWTIFNSSKSVAAAIRTFSLLYADVNVLWWYLWSKLSPHLIEMTTAVIFFFESVS